jgi:6-pyruvoyltetrahydropterin/6-carboxytetrahydropterin synthase
MSDSENADFFGPCNYPNFHGHNYELVVKVTGEVDERTGYVVDMKVLSDIIQEHVIEKFDHKNLNLDTDEFRTLNPTAENIAMVIHSILSNKLDSRYDLKVTLYETERNFVEFPA